MKSVRPFAENRKEEHQFWLVMIGLFTGARVWEITQINPQFDIQKDKNNIWFFNFTNDNSGKGVKKTHKNESSKRKVPIHPELFNLGFEDFFNRIKKSGQDRIFRDWIPVRGDPARYAALWFGDYLVSTGMRDDTKGRKITGMHSLRSTFMSHLVNCLMNSGMGKMDAVRSIRRVVGHTEGGLDEFGKGVTVTLGYVDNSVLDKNNDDLPELSRIVELLSYKPVTI